MCKELGSETIGCLRYCCSLPMMKSVSFGSNWSLSQKKTSNCVQSSGTQVSSTIPAQSLAIQSLRFPPTAGAQAAVSKRSDLQIFFTYKVPCFGQFAWVQKQMDFIDSHSDTNCQIARTEKGIRSHMPPFHHALDLRSLCSTPPSMQPCRLKIC